MTGPGAPWKARSVWVAAVVAVLGTGFWRSDGPRPQPVPPAREQAGRTTRAAPPASQKASSASPAAVRLGASYIGGFFLGWCYRRFVTLSVALTGGVLAVLMAVKSLGWFDSDVASLQGQVRESSAWLSTHASAVNRYLAGLLPSTAAAGVGLFKGFRRKRVPAVVEKAG